jgi:hypothetical protein
MTFTCGAPQRRTVGLYDDWTRWRNDWLSSLLLDPVYVACSEPHACLYTLRVANRFASTLAPVPPLCSPRKHEPQADKEQCAGQCECDADIP